MLFIYCTSIIFSYLLSLYFSCQSHLDFWVMTCSRDVCITVPYSLSVAVSLSYILKKVIWRQATYSKIFTRFLTLSNNISLFCCNFKNALNKKVFRLKYLQSILHEIDAIWYLNVFQQSEAAARNVVWKRILLKISQNSQESTHARTSFLIKL